MRFENPYIIYFLWLAPILVLFLFYSHKKRIYDLKKFCNQALWCDLIQGISFKTRVLRYILIVLAFILIILALSRPQWGYYWQEKEQNGIDIYLALDISDSMLATDITPNRLERAKMMIKDLLTLVNGDRIGLIIFSGTSFIQCPLTLDYNVLNVLIDTISPSSISTQGTSIASALKIAVDAFDRSAESSSKAVILISDGEDHMGKVLDVAKEAQNKHIKVYTIGIGQQTGAYIPTETGFKTDMLGNKILSKPNFSQLKKIAEITKGSFIPYSSGWINAENIYNNLIKKDLKDKKHHITKEKDWIERYQPFLAGALALLLVAYLLEKPLLAKGER